MTTVKTRMVKAAALVEDLSFYPRNQLDDQYVRELADALLAGVTLPPLVVERGSGRIIDGFHRRRAALRAFDADAEVAVIERLYADEQTLWLEVMRLNAHHGRRLSRYDMARCLLRSKELGLDPEVVAQTLQVTVARLADIEARKVAFGPDATPVPIMRTAEHLAGSTLSEGQMAAVRRATGMPVLVYVNQVINAIEGDLLDNDNEKLRARLVILHERLSAWLAARTLPHAAA